MLYFMRVPYILFAPRFSIVYMRNSIVYVLSLGFLFMTACTPDPDRPQAEVTIPDFDFPQTTVFEPTLSAYNIFEGDAQDLIPSAEFQEVELSSILFTDYAHKQRLVKVPAGTQMTRLSDGSIDFPEGTILTKTFFYLNDERDESRGKRIIETRLLVKESGVWNVATYLWNAEQTEATLTLEGVDTQVSWVDEDGTSLSTLYHVPTQNECMTCHQSSTAMTPLGPTLRNLNRNVTRNGAEVNQIAHLQSLGLLNDFSLSLAPQIVDYSDQAIPLAERGRAYLAMNCAHCHNPDAWDTPAERDFDFRYETPLDQTGIPFGEDRIVDALLDQEMPFIGTTLLDQEGVDLVVEFIESL